MDYLDDDDGRNNHFSAPNATTTSTSTTTTITTAFTSPPPPSSSSSTISSFIKTLNSSNDPYSMIGKANGQSVKPVDAAIQSLNGPYISTNTQNQFELAANAKASEQRHKRTNEKIHKKENNHETGNGLDHVPDYVDEVNGYADNDENENRLLDEDDVIDTLNKVIDYGAISDVSGSLYRSSNNSDGDSSSSFDGDDGNDESDCSTVISVPSVLTFSSLPSTATSSIADKESVVMKMNNHNNCDDDEDYVVDDDDDDVDDLLTAISTTQLQSTNHRDFVDNNEHLDRKIKQLKMKMKATKSSPTNNKHRAVSSMLFDGNGKPNGDDVPSNNNVQIHNYSIPIKFIDDFDGDDEDDNVGIKISNDNSTLSTTTLSSIEKQQQNFNDLNNKIPILSTFTINNIGTDSGNVANNIGVNGGRFTASSAIISNQILEPISSTTSSHQPTSSTMINTTIGSSLNEQPTIPFSSSESTMVSTSSLSSSHINSRVATSITTTSPLVVVDDLTPSLFNGGSNVDLEPPPQLSSSSSSVSQNSSNNLSPFAIEEPFAILTKKENSCPFVERRISLAKQIKVGRSIGRTKPSPDNAVFDCKVLSRNHALLWYQDEMFYLKDTGSSNGTFVNNQRLSSTNERSPPHIIYSGDCIQFGVEVTEKKNVHSCVIASIRLFHPDGSEAKKNHSNIRMSDVLDDQQCFNSYPNSIINIDSSQLMFLSFYIKELVRKQTLLENQLQSMRQVMKESLDSAKDGWYSLVEEDRLLSRIQILQSQLEVCLVAKNKDAPKENIVEFLKQKNLQLITDKEQFEQSLKNSLQETMKEKIEFETNLKLAKTELNMKIEECQMLKDSLNNNITEMKTLVQNCDKFKKEKDELLTKVKKYEDLPKNANVPSIVLTKQSNTEDSNRKTQEQETQTEFNNEKISLIQDFQKRQDEPTSNISTLSMLAQEATTTLKKQPESHLLSGLIADNRKQSSLLKQQYVPTNETFLDTNHSLVIRQQCSIQTQTDNDKNSFHIENFQNFLNAMDTLFANNLQAIELLSKKISLVRIRFQNLKTIFCHLKNCVENAKQLKNEIQKYKKVIMKQNEENEKYKCDIEALEYNLKTLMDVKTINMVDRNIEHKSVQTAALNDDEANSMKSKTMTTTTESSKNPLLNCVHCSKLKGILISLDKHLVENNKRLRLNVNHSDSSQKSSIQNDSKEPGSNNIANLKEMTMLKILDSTTVCDDNFHDKMDLMINEHLQRLSNDFAMIFSQNENLINEIGILKENYNWLSLKNEFSYFIAVLPLFIIFVAIVLAFYNPLSFLTGTFDL